MNTVKTIGLIFILFGCSGFGFIKADALKKRSRTLKSICIGLEKLYQLVENSSLESAELIELSFGEIFIGSTACLKPADAELINRFLNEFGMGDREKECRNISLYKTLFEKQFGEAEDCSNRLYKLYNSLGFLTGLLICIFLV
ncbi:MAG: stage III sporulation protein AB [Acutalibacteraceae bacterium]|nr:stage III sporulation protein AB [Acutalibacteraceae bacterium]